MPGHLRRQPRCLWTVKKSESAGNYFNDERTTKDERLQRFIGLQGVRQRLSTFNADLVVCEQQQRCVRRART